MWNVKFQIWTVFWFLKYLFTDGPYIWRLWRKFIVRNKTGRITRVQTQTSHKQRNTPPREQYHSLALSHFHFTNTYNKHTYGFPVGNFSSCFFSNKRNRKWYQIACQLMSEIAYLGLPKKHVLSLFQILFVWIWHTIVTYSVSHDCYIFYNL